MVGLDGNFEPGHAKMSPMQPKGSKMAACVLEVEPKPEKRKPGRPKKRGRPKKEYQAKKRRLMEKAKATSIIEKKRGKVVF